MTDLVLKAISKGAQIFASVSGGKDGQAMVKVLHNNNFPIAALIHADLGKMEWNESLPMCEKLADEFRIDLYTLHRTDGAGLLEHWQKRMHKLSYAASDVATRHEIKVSEKPFWSSSEARYCTSDLKRDVIDKCFRNLKCNFIISAEGIRSGESRKRAAKNPFEIRKRITHPYYDGMTVEEAIENYNPEYRLAITWYPIFNFSLEEVWNTYGMTSGLLETARKIYQDCGKVPEWWPFHPAYVYGNERVSCVFCVLASVNDLKTGAKHRPELLNELIDMEDYSGFTFKENWSLRNLVA